jgi:hypothetical protein
VLLAVGFALVAASSSAVNLMMQHVASMAAPKREKGWQLALYLVRQPLWLLGVLAAVAPTSSRRWLCTTARCRWSSRS